MAGNSTANLSNRTTGFAVGKLLKRGQLDMVFERFGQVDKQAKNKSKVRKYRRYLSLAPANAPLQEGVPPVGKQITFEDLTCSLEQFGDQIRITDVIVDTHEDPVLNEAMDLCGEQIAETIELIRYEILRAGTNVFYANGVDSRALVAGPAQANDFKKIYRSFRRNRAKFISEIIKATPQTATEPVAPAFFAVAHSDCDADLRAISGFVPVEKYADSSKSMPNELGKYENIRFLSINSAYPWELAGVSGTSNLSAGVAPSSAGKADVYPILIFARDAYGIVPLQGEEAVDIKTYNPGQASPTDPLGQNGFVSWKTWQTAIILNQFYMARLEVAATAL